MQKKYINLSIAANIATIQLYCEIGEDWGWDDNEKRAGDLETFAGQMEEAAAANVELIKVRISSPGGDIAHGLPIANLISQSAIPVHTYNDGLCYSMAAVILAAGHKVFAAENSKIMLHSARTYARGNAKEFETETAILRGYDSTIAGILAAKTGGEVEQILAAYFDGADHYLTAKEAKEAGLVDELIAPVKQANMIAAIASVLGFGANKAAKEKEAAPIVEDKRQTKQAAILKEMEAKGIALNERITAGLVLLDGMKAKIEALEAALAIIQQKPSTARETFTGSSIETAPDDIIGNLPHNRAADKFFLNNKNH